ncbi:WbqC family protein [Candidatus Woesearchaeota archaeon]|nr:WbqC family protein [Candidatus Woesearchaeota archaeon]
MKRKVAIHQINYLPWIGYFNKIKICDVFVFLDSVDYVKNNYMNRNKIKTNTGWCYLTIPIERRYYRKPFNMVTLPNNADWADNHWKTIELNYRKAPYFNSYKDFFEKSYKSLPKILGEFNEKFIRHIIKLLDINTELLKSSDLNLDRELKKTDLLLEIVRRTNGVTYISGVGAKNYMEIEKFTDVNLEFQNFVHPDYHQLHGDWIPYLSIIDLIFNEGEKSKNFI